MYANHGWRTEKTHCKALRMGVGGGSKRGMETPQSCMGALVSPVGNGWGLIPA